MYHHWQKSTDLVGYSVDGATQYFLGHNSLESTYTSSVLSSVSSSGTFSFSRAGTGLVSEGKFYSQPPLQNPRWGGESYSSSSVFANIAITRPFLRFRFMFIPTVLISTDK
ncbi:hypothetical protein AZE42_11127 [Rhizopogon vesiculosus]|uniref:Uncharacterized protein n=1 Tax=Rhizopogon vesiculosus TaxID=180088 RepID=A0A1J8QFK1_9AGAM|nr:hypothetical protein AZE42_11127 [Rhizopogon vesiculosus]